MQKIFCRHCESFIPDKSLSVYKGKLVNGNCEHHQDLCFSEDSICENFELREGLHITNGLSAFFESKKTGTE